jgi:holliday junction DNA helicase RuvA
MISTVRGTVLDIALDHVVIEVGGLGLAVRTTPGVLAQLHTGTEASLATVLMVREDALTLYGFLEDAAREQFLLLQTVPGIGPRVALATLAVLTPDQLRQALTGEEITTLTRVPGIGRKGAERLIIELRDRVAPTSPTGIPAPAGVGPTTAGGAQTAAREHVIRALVGLGFTAQNAGQAVAAVTADEPADAPLDQARTLRAALTRLGSNR